MAVHTLTIREVLHGLYQANMDPELVVVPAYQLFLDAGHTEERLVPLLKPEEVRILKERKYILPKRLTGAKAKRKKS